MKIICNGFRRIGEIIEEEGLNIVCTKFSNAGTFFVVYERFSFFFLSGGYCGRMTLFRNSGGVFVFTFLDEVLNRRLFLGKEEATPW